MARINLLPWRQEERERKNKEFGIMLAATAILTALALMLAFSLLNRELSEQQKANDMITTENARLDEVLVEIKSLEEQREEMLSRMEIIQNLQGFRSVPVRIWDDIARAMPASMYLTGAKREGDVLTLTGYAANTTVVSDLIRNLDASEWLDDSFMLNAKDDNILAYANKNPSKANKDPNAPQRPIYPEDSYIFFTVSSKVVTKMAEAPEEVQVQNGQVLETAQQVVATAAPTQEQQPNGTDMQSVQPNAPAVQGGAQQPAQPGAQQGTQPAAQDAPAVGTTAPNPVQSSSEPNQATGNTANAPAGGQ